MAVSEIDSVGENPKNSRARSCCAPVGDLCLPMPDANALAATFKAIGHPVRLQILSILSRYGGQVCVCDIESQFELAQPTISHHLKVLRRAGLIECSRQGQWYFYTVAPDGVTVLRNAIDTLASAPNTAP